MYHEINDANQDTTRYIIKRSGKQVPYEPDKIRKAIQGANHDELREDERLTDAQVDHIVEIITSDVFKASRAYSVEEIQDKVEREINKLNYNIFLNFHDYRRNHQDAREKSGLDKKIEAIVDVQVHEDGSVEGGNEEVNQENSNKNPVINSVMRDYIAGEWCRHYARDYMLDEDVKQANDLGLIHFHDMDYYPQPMYNCALINLEDMLQNGTSISSTPIETPKSFATACTVMSQISAAVASLQYGGQSMTLSHLAPFVDVSRQKLRRHFAEDMKATGINATDEQINAMAERELLKEVQAGCQTIQYQLITLQSTNGQAPFITLFMYINEVPEGQLRDDLVLVIKTFLEQRLEGIKDKNGNRITIAFPKLIYVLQENNIEPDSEYYWLSELAAKCTAKRLVPDYVSEKVMKNLKGGDVYPPMGCRSFLTPDRFTDAGIGNIANAKNFTDDKHKYYGRFNQGVVTLNLVDIACSSRKDMTKFWEIMNERLELCHRALRSRHEHLLGIPSDVSPILFQDGAIARLKPGEVIDPLLYNGYSTISLGYAGLAECVHYMLDASHTSPEGKQFGLEVMQALNDACDKWKKAENIDYSVYGTPLESTTYKFAKSLQRRFGVIEGVTDHAYITNSYHIHVTENIDAFNKLTKEATFQQLSPGGAISYVEVPNMQNNIPAVLAVMHHIYDTILYAELNTKSDLCEVCGYDGEIQIIEENGKLMWKCPQCGNTDQHKMHVTRRTCGYIGTQFWNQGRTAEIKDRVLHL